MYWPCITKIKHIFNAGFYLYNSRSLIQLDSKPLEHFYFMPVAVCPMPDLEPANKTSTFMVYSCPDGYVFGAVCRLNCTHGYPLIGSDTITCERDDSTYPPTMSWDWSGPSAVKPVCEGRAPPLMDLCAQVCMNSHGPLCTGMHELSWISARRYHELSRTTVRRYHELSWTSVYRCA